MDKFKVIIASDVDYDKLIAEIYYEGKFVALIDQDNGINDMRIEFPGSENSEPPIIKTLPLQEFVDAINRARDLLLTREI